MKIIILILLLPIILLAQTDCLKYEGNPVLNAGPEGSWDEVLVNYPSVIVEGESYKMWYAGKGVSGFRIGYATSEDGIAWTKYDGNPVLDVGTDGSWDDVYVATPHVIFEQDTYKMWYSGYDGTAENIGYATSADGIIWEKQEAPVLEIGISGQWDDTFIWTPKVLHVEDGYNMWYGGFDDDGNIRVGFAKSSDGITSWEKDEANPIISPTKHWERTYLYPGPVLSINGGFMMWYAAGLPDTEMHSGYATSQDGISWNKADEINPILSRGPSGDWDYPCSSIRSVYFDGEIYHFWYDSYKYDVSGAIGYATSIIVDPTKVEEKASIPVEYNLSQNYPNPFNPITKINYSISNQSYVTLKVFDVLGREVSTLVNKEQTVGNYEVGFDASMLTSGIYFYRIQAGDFVETKKMILMK